MKREGIAAPANAQDALDREQLADANINPVTGLSTDYLNHFSEAIMLLDFVLHSPECRADLARWRPVTYREHFAASDLRHRDLALAAYGAMDVRTRHQFEATCEALSAEILAYRAALAAVSSEAAGAQLVGDAMAKLKPLFARASAIIHGLDSGEPAPSAGAASVL